MAWQMNSDRPIYSQLYDKILIRHCVAESTRRETGFPSVRELAAEASVNPNTMQRAFAELEHSGLIVTQRNSGRVVTEDLIKIEEAKHQLALAQVNSFFANMRELGYNDQEILELVKSIIH